MNSHLPYFLCGLAAGLLSHTVVTTHPTALPLLMATWFLIGLGAMYFAYRRAKWSAFQNSIDRYAARQLDLSAKKDS